MVLYIGGSVCEVTFIRDLGTWPVVRRVFSLLGCLNSRTHRHSPYTTKVHCRTDRSAPRGHQCQPDSRTLNSIESVHQGTCAHAQVSNTVEHTLGFFDGCRGRGWGGVSLVRTLSIPTPERCSSVPGTRRSLRLVIERSGGPILEAKRRKATDDQHEHSRGVASQLRKSQQLRGDSWSAAVGRGGVVGIQACKHGARTRLGVQG